MTRRLFYAFFSTLNYFDVEPSIVDSTLKERDYYIPIISGLQVSPRALGQALGVDALIFGEVTSYGKSFALLYSEVVVGLNTRMVRCSDGKVLWQNDHKVVSSKGSMPLSLTGLATGFIRTLVDHSMEKVVNTAAITCLELVETVPDLPPYESMESLPKIKVFAHNGAGSFLLPGESLRAVLVGEAGGLASWDLEPVFRNRPMEEVEPGVYLGTYGVEDGGRLASGRPVGRLMNGSGAAVWNDILGPVSFGDPVYLSGSVSDEVVLTEGESPYIIDTLIIEAGGSLRMQEGVVAKVKGLGLVVGGELHIEGSREKPVRISGDGPFSWKGILVNGDAASCTMQYCSISDAQFGLKVIDTDLTLRHSVFQENTWGVVLDDAQAEIQNIMVRSSQKAGVSARNSQVDIRDSHISENEGGGIMLLDTHADIGNSTISLNSSWDLKAEKGKVVAKNNWWGTAKPVEGLVVGDVPMKPVKKSPIIFLPIDEY
jgi:hypothetical protein